MAAKLNNNNEVISLVWLLRNVFLLSNVGKTANFEKDLSQEKNVIISFIKRAYTQPEMVNK